MKVLTFDESRDCFAEVLTRVVENCEEVVITRSGHEPVVIVPLAEYESLQETVSAHRTRRDIRVLEERIARVERG